MARTAVIGAGLYGVMVALQRALAGDEVVLLDRENDILKRASYHNQARIHGGYHYPRNRLTGRRSVANLSRFLSRFPDAVTRPGHALYAIARQGSKVTPGQFEAFCADIDTPLMEIDRSQRRLFDASMIEAAYLVEEPVIDASLMRAQLRAELQRQMHIALTLDAEVLGIRAWRNNLGVFFSRQGGNSMVEVNRVINCTYSGLRTLVVEGTRARARLKHEITEIALIQPPKSLDSIGITVMDGDFWSTLPFPDRMAHSLSHVGHTPHGAWQDDAGESPYARLLEYLPNARSRGTAMIRDASRYVPEMAGARQIGSLWEVKTVWVNNEANDGRPILLERHPALPVWHVLGGKLDNVFDLLDALELELDAVAAGRHVTAKAAFA